MQGNRSVPVASQKPKIKTFFISGQILTREIQVIVIYVLQCFIRMLNRNEIKKNEINISDLI